jgi:hypothetical protein
VEWSDRDGFWLEGAISLLRLPLNRIPSGYLHYVALYLQNSAGLHRQNIQRHLQSCDGRTNFRMLPNLLL